MYHSLIGKPSLRVGLVMGLLIGLCSAVIGRLWRPKEHERWLSFHRRSDRLSPLLRSRPAQDQKRHLHDVP